MSPTEHRQRKKHDTTPTVHPIVLWPFVEAVRRLGLQIPALPELDAVLRPNAERITHERARTLLELAIAVTGRDDLGVLAAHAVEPGHFELVELATRAQQSVGEGIRTLATLTPILHDALVVKLVRAAPRSRLRVTLDRRVPLHPAGYDFMVASLVIGGRRQTGLASLEPLAVRLPYPEPAAEPALRQLLTCSLEFGADALELEFETDALDTPLLRANPPMAQVLEGAARELLEAKSSRSPLEAALREHVREGLRAGATEAKQLARKLHTSERTLRRKLEAEGLGLREIIDDVRRELALERLKDVAASTESISAELGFTTAQAFHRAFRRWTGGTIQAFRARSR